MIIIIVFSSRSESEHFDGNLWDVCVYVYMYMCVGGCVWVSVSGVLKSSDSGTNFLVPKVNLAPQDWFLEIYC